MNYFSLRDVDIDRDTEKPASAPQHPVVSNGEWSPRAVAVEREERRYEKLLENLEII